MPPTTTRRVSIDVHLGPEDWLASLKAEASAGLVGSPKQIPPTWFYDDRGCALFDDITRLPEYYLTRSERAILTEHATDIVAHAAVDTLVELGCGTADKTRLLLNAMRAADRLRRYVPFDVAEPTVRATAYAIADEYSGVDVHAVVGDFRRHVVTLPTGGNRVIAFLGGTVGNLRPAERAELYRAVASNLAPGETFLLGYDLVKSRDRLLAAYNDAAGVTAEFNRNVLRVLNRELGATFDESRFDHVALFDEDNEWIEMRLRSRGAQHVDIPGLELSVDFADGEDLLTETSAKFRVERVEAELRGAGLEPVGLWLDPTNDFALSLATR